MRHFLDKIIYGENMKLTRKNIIEGHGNSSESRKFAAAAAVLVGGLILLPGCKHTGSMEPRNVSVPQSRCESEAKASGLTDFVSNPVNGFTSNSRYGTWHARENYIISATGRVGGCTIHILTASNRVYFEIEQKLYTQDKVYGPYTDRYPPGTTIQLGHYAVTVKPYFDTSDLTVTAEINVTVRPHPSTSPSPVE